MTIYDRLGENNLSKLVGVFYAQIAENDVLSGLFPKDLTEVKLKQQLFLTQYFGGEQLYSAKFGYPRMKIRHIPFHIGSQERDAWLSLMKKAIGTLDITDEFKDEIYNCFPRLANHMMNK